MRLNLLCIGTLLLFVISTVAQPMNQQRDSMLKIWLVDNCYCDVHNSCDKKFYYTARQYISTYSMNRLLRKDLTKITMDAEGLPSLGNFVTSQFSDDKTKLTLNGSFYNAFRKSEEWQPIRNILSFTVKAATKDNISTLFSSNNVNNEVGIKLKWSLLDQRTLYEYTDANNCNSLKLHRERLVFEYENAHARFKIDSLVYVAQRKEFIDKTSKKRDSLKLLQIGITSETDNSKKELLVKEQNRINIEIQDIYKDYTIYLRSKPVLDSSKILDSMYTRLLDLETKEVKWNRFHISWTDIESSANGEKLLLFNRQSLLDSQITEEKFTRWSLGVFRNVFMSKGSRFFQHGFFLKFGYSIGNDHSLTDETAKEISTNIIIDTPGFRRQVTEKKNAFDIAFTKSFSHKFSGRFSKYLNIERSQAFSLGIELVSNFNELEKFYKSTGKIIVTPGIAYHYGFQNPEKDKNLVNIELFLRLKDVLNSAEVTNSDFYNRHELGINLALPFNSIFLNK